MNSSPPRVTRRSRLTFEAVGGQRASGFTSTDLDKEQPMADILGWLNARVKVA